MPKIRRSSSSHGALTTTGTDDTVRSRKDSDARDRTSYPTDPSSVYGNGCFQRMSIFCAQLAAFVFLCHALSITLIAPYVDHWCKPPIQYSNVSADEWKNMSIPYEGGRYSHCTQYDNTDSPANRTVRDCSAWEYDRSTYSETIVTRWDLVCGRKRLVYLESTIFMSGATVGVPIAGMLSDNIGRKPTISVAVIVLIASGLAACFTRTFFTFVLFRFFVSASVAVVRIMTFILVFEVATPELRCFQCTLVQLGHALALAFVHGLRELHLGSTLAQVIVMAPTCCLICSFVMLEESPRWLLAMSDVQAAECVMMWAAKVNGLSLPEAAKRLQMMKKRLRREVDSSTKMVSATLLSLIRSDTLKERTIIICTCWTSFILTYNQFRLTIKVTASSVARMVGTIGQCPAIAVAYLLMERLGRRILVMMSLIAISALLLLQVLARALNLGDILRDVLIVMEDAVLPVLIVVTYIFTMELYPTELRSAAVSSAYLFGRVGALMGPALAQVGLLTHASVPLVITGTLDFLSGVLSAKLPETRRLALKDNVKEKQVRSLGDLDVERTRPK